MTDTTAAAGPTFQVTPDFWRELPQMSLEKYPGTQGFIDDVYVNPESVPMCAGYFELRHTEAPLDYYYDYDEMKVVLEGEFRLENVDTGQVQIAKAKDAIFFPKGSRILFSTPDRGLAFYVGYRSFAP
ncbi:ethanolamine utilization protein [Mycobacterium sp. djl-10]|jgi:ethanolamine utilization protein EutQ|nr:ethanolamine utilization protein [Mycobacterium sp. djl-10]